MGSPHMQLIGQALNTNGIRVPRRGQLANTTQQLCGIDYIMEAKA